MRRRSVAPAKWERRSVKHTRRREGRVIIRLRRGKLITEQPAHYCNANKVLDEATKKGRAAVVVMLQDDGCVVVAGHVVQDRAHIFEILARALHLEMDDMKVEYRAMAKTVKRLDRAKRRSLR